MLKKFLIALPVLLVAGAGGAWWYINDRARTLVDERLDALVASGSYQELDYEELQIRANGDITMTNLHVVQQPFEYTLQEITVTNYDYANEFPRYLDLSIRGLEFTGLDGNSFDPQVLALSTLVETLGTGSTLPLQIDYSLRYDPDNAHQTDSIMRLAVTDAFTLHLSGITRNLQMERTAAISQDPAAAQAQPEMMALLAEAEIPSMNLSLLDEGFLDTMISNAAEQNGVAPEDFRNLLVSQARNLYLFLPPSGQELAMRAGNELAAFLEGGKTLSVSIAPEYGGNIRRLQEEIMGAVFTGNYNQVSELLHLEITAH